MTNFRVLIVEDEILLAMDLEMLLADAGCTIAGIASSSTQALRIAADEKPNLAFIDVNLADGPTGVEVGRSLATGGTTSVVFMTANVARLPNDYAGAIGVIGKPYTSGGLTSALSYLHQGIFTPPPSIERPSCLMLSIGYEQRWLKNDR